MARGTVTPGRGDIVYLNLDTPAWHGRLGPRSGSGGSGGGQRGPALVLSPTAYNEATGHLIACPIVHQTLSYPFEVALPTGAGVAGVILSDQPARLDWRSRRADFAARAPKSTLEEVLGKLGAILA
ncbi:MAG: type II toxin-antitoxin system PemK/MazF family toxin [Nitrospinota bacterium]|nr:type II toxin-antitoxin system PemK/MazF family toxin [Nitrospinota bacterium]